MSPPAIRPASESQAAGSSPLGKQAPEKLSACVKVLNAPWNGSPWIKRRAADFYVAQGRAEFVDAYKWVSVGGVERIQAEGLKEQLRLVRHEANTDKNEEAARGYQWPEGKVVTQRELLQIGVVCPAKAIKENLTVRSEAPGQRHYAGRSGAVTGSSGRPIPEKRVAPITWSPTSSA